MLDFGYASGLLLTRSSWPLENRAGSYGDHLPQMPGIDHRRDLVAVYPPHCPC